jgi:hypothetical protein
MWFSVYCDYISSIVDLFLYLCMESYSTHLDLLNSWESDEDGVSTVLRLYLPAFAPYMSGPVVDRGDDSTIESFVVHPLYVGLVEAQLLQLCQVSLLIFRSKSSPCIGMIAFPP